MLEYVKSELDKLRHIVGFVIVGFVNKSAKRLVALYRIVVKVGNSKFCSQDSCA